MASDASTIAFFEPAANVTPSSPALLTTLNRRISVAYDGDSGAEYESTLETIDERNDRASSTNGSAVAEQEKIGDADKVEKSASDEAEETDDELNMVIDESALDEDNDLIIPGPSDVLKPKRKSQASVGPSETESLTPKQKSEPVESPVEEPTESLAPKRTLKRKLRSAEVAVVDPNESLTPKQTSGPVESPAEEPNESLTPKRTPKRKLQPAAIAVVDETVSLIPEQESAPIEEIAVKPDDQLASKSMLNLRSASQRDLNMMSTPKRKRNKPWMPMQHPNILSTPKRKLLSGGDAQIERIMKQHVTVEMKRVRFDSISGEWILPENVEHTVTNARTAHAVEDDSDTETTAKVI